MKRRVPGRAGLLGIKGVRRKIKEKKRGRAEKEKREPPRDPCTVSSIPYWNLLLVQPDLSKVRFIRRLYLPPAIHRRARCIPSLAVSAYLPGIPAFPFSFPIPVNRPPVYPMRWVTYPRPPRTDRACPGYVTGEIFEAPGV